MVHLRLGRRHGPEGLLPNLSDENLRGSKDGIGDTWGDGADPPEIEMLASNESQPCNVLVSVTDARAPLVVSLTVTVKLGDGHACSEIDMSIVSPGLASARVFSWPKLLVLKAVERTQIRIHLNFPAKMREMSSHLDNR